VTVVVEVITDSEVVVVDASSVVVVVVGPGPGHSSHEEKHNIAVAIKDNTPLKLILEFFTGK
jgi:hypothetical protein